MNNRPHILNSQRLKIPVIAYLIVEYMHYNDCVINYYKPPKGLKYIGMSLPLFQYHTMKVLFEKGYLKVVKNGSKGDLELKSSIKKRMSNYVASKVEVEQMFEEIFWKEYPSKIGKAAAKKAFFKLPFNDNSNLIQDIIDGIEKRKLYESQLSPNDFKPEWPHASSYLNGERWKDEYLIKQTVQDKKFKKYQKEVL